MRNNFRYSNFVEVFFYVKGLCKVVEDFKKEVFFMENNKFVKFKVDVKKRCEVREKEENERNREKWWCFIVLEE